MSTATRKPPRFTTDTARSFDRYSVQNAVNAERTLQEASICSNGCKAYEDIFTYARWQALGYQVRRGEHGAHLPVIVHSEHEEPDGTIKDIKLFRDSTVFCRCQVEAKNAH